MLGGSWGSRGSRGHHRAARSSIRRASCRPRRNIHRQTMRRPVPGQCQARPPIDASAAAPPAKQRRRGSRLAAFNLKSVAVSASALFFLSEAVYLVAAVPGCARPCNQGFDFSQRYWAERWLRSSRRETQRSNTKISVKPHCSPLSLDHTSPCPLHSESAIANGVPMLPHRVASHPVAVPAQAEGAPAAPAAPARRPGRKLRRLRTPLWRP